MQGDPLAVVSYGIIFLTLIKSLKSAYPGIIQPWYADDARSLGMFDHMELYFKSLKLDGPERWYYRKLTNIILVVHPDNIKPVKLFGTCNGFKVCTAMRYLVGYIGDD